MDCKTRTVQNGVVVVVVCGGGVGWLRWEARGKSIGNISVSLGMEKNLNSKATIGINTSSQSKVCVACCDFFSIFSGLQVKLN